jgi:hypothetical protein
MPYSETGLLFHQEVKPPPKKGIQKSELNDERPCSPRGTVDSDVVIRPTTPRTKPPCVMTTGVWYGQRDKFQSPRHVKVTPNQYTTETTGHSSSVKGKHVSTVYVPVTPSTPVIFVTTLEFPGRTDSLIMEGPRKESVWLSLRKTGSCVWSRDSP